MTSAPTSSHESEHRTGSPILGEARWFDLHAGEAVAENAAWSFEEPPAGAEAVAGLIAFEWDALDRWYEEDEEVIVHLRDPYHRIDAMPTSRRLRISLDGEVLAETQRARVLFETGLPPRWYIPREDVKEGLLGAQRASHRLRLQGIRLLLQRPGRRPRGAGPGLDLSRSAPRGRVDPRTTSASLTSASTWRSTASCRSGR